MTKEQDPDLEEFAQRAGKGRNGLKPGEAMVASGHPGPPQEISKERSVRAGKLVQWAANGEGFSPMTQTSVTLPAGVYEVSQQDGQVIFTPQEIVSDKLLRLPDSKSDMVIAEIERFWPRGDLFRKCGFAHKRGFLLWGDQGSGKTSTIKFVMADMVARGGLVVLGNCYPSLLAKALRQLRQVERERHLVVVMEDIDALIRQYGEQDVLSILDGESSISGAVFVATTNYPEDLASRITNRPVRFDQVVKIGMPNAEARRMYIESRELGLPAETIDRWVDATDGMSISHLHELIVAVVCLGNDLDATVARLRSMSRRPKSDEVGPVGFGRD